MGTETLSKSSFLPPDSVLSIHFSNETKIILKRILSGILLSLLLVLTVIMCLFYLLNIIKRQKQLAEVKNDLISNITHEFKTPIATISTALEAIENFNVVDDPDKTKKYAAISSHQLGKLSQMVEKLLETATLDSERLVLKKEKTDIIQLTERLVEKYALLGEKELVFHTNKDQQFFNIDTFHFENAISNLIDNAIKYGGDNISINAKVLERSLLITVSDDGPEIPKTHKEKIFEKFYRIPTGNTHDVKGFGIGLYYSKHIIEKHGGSITLKREDNFNIFQITLPL